MRRSMLLPMVMVVPVLLAAGCDRRSGQGEQGAGNVVAVSPDEAAPAAAAPASASKIDRSHVGTPAPDFAFVDPAGKPVTLAVFKGKPVLLNLWATWCGPCVRELPTLNALAIREAGKLQVIALNQDSDGAKAAPFLAERKLAALRPYTDPKTRWLSGATSTLPTTILYGADGKERWRALGDLDWTGAEATKALAEAK